METMFIFRSKPEVQTEMLGKNFMIPITFPGTRLSLIFHKDAAEELAADLAGYLARLEQMPSETPTPETPSEPTPPVIAEST